MNPPAAPPHLLTAFPRSGLPPALRLACRRHGVRLTRHVLVVRVARQRVQWFTRSPQAPGSHDYRLVREFLASTSRFGTGQQAGSHCTPLGLHRIARKIGGGWPVGTVFESRRAVGFTWAGRPDAAIAHRILWLDGLEPGGNRGGPVDTFARYIYLHGVGDELTLGRPASRGCVHLAAADLMPLYERLPVGTLVWVAAS
jgi:hypothetical protein